MIPTIDGPYHPNWNYLVHLHKANPDASQIIHIFGDDEFDTNVTVTHYVDDKFLNTYTLQVKSEVGSYQNVILFPSDTRIHSEHPVYVVGGVANGTGDERMVVSEFTQAMYISPPRSNGCENKLSINLYATSTHYTYTPITRFGGIRGTVASDIWQFENAFIHYIPNTSQFIKGDIRFVTYSPNSNVDICADSDVANAATRLDYRNFD
uniref:IgGFc_binding domain-containing protein n=1 Tax=Rhabditophanes sp. KR3021 TaxID=114890 RepID=A0AC35UFI2_9BILA